MGRPDKIDYAREFANFELANAILEPDGQRLTLADLSEALGVSSHSLSVHFAAEREKAENAEIISNLRAIARKGSDKVSRAIGSFKADTVKDLAGIAKITYGAADRVGHAPQAYVFQMNQTQATQVNLSPLISNASQEDYQKLIGEEVKPTQEEK
jgi:predicted HAD superfamily Cof-like phosphohydrolase